MSTDTQRRLLWLGMGVTLFPALALNQLLPNFEDIYKNFGVKLPPLTQMLIEGRHVLWLLPLLVYALWWWARRSASRLQPGSLAIIAGFLIAGVTMSLGVIALYQPIFALPEAVGQ